MHGPNRSFYLHEYEWNELSTRITYWKTKLTAVYAGKPANISFRVGESFEFFHYATYCCTERKYTVRFKSLFRKLQNCLPFICIYHSYWPYGCCDFCYVCGCILICVCKRLNSSILLVAYDISRDVVGIKGIIKSCFCILKMEKYTWSYTKVSGRK